MTINLQSRYFDLITAVVEVAQRLCVSNRFDEEDGEKKDDAKYCTFQDEWTEEFTFVEFFAE